MIIGKKTAEAADMADIKQSELSAAQSEFFKVRNEIDAMLENLTLVQVQKASERLRDLVNGFSMNSVS